MPLSNAELKGRAKGLIAGSKPNVILVGAIFILLSLLFSVLSSRISLVRMTVENLERYYSYLESESPQHALAFFQTLLPTPTEQLISWLLNLVLSVVGVGWVIFLLNTLRGAGPSYGNLLDGFGFFFRIILLNILTGLFIALWSLLLIVPGIIASYRYRLATYLLIDHPEYSVMDCIRQSKALMAGHKGELFLLDLSFIGWSLLMELPYVGYAVMLWALPYMDMTYALYYEARRAASFGAFPPNYGKNYGNGGPGSF